MSFQAISLATKGILSGVTIMIKRYILPLDLKLKTDTIKLNLKPSDTIKLHLKLCED